MGMPRWLGPALKRIRALAEAGRVRFTLKARRELAELGSGLDEEDARDVLARLTARDSAGRLASASTGEWMFLFKPALGGVALYLKLVLRDDCVVVSFHKDEGDDHEEGS